MALTLSKDGNMEIYVLDLRSRRLRRMTNNGAIDTEAAWAPDGRSIIFTSDRAGQPQIYQMPAAGGQNNRMTFEGKYNAGGRFSPEGDKMAYVHETGGAYRIAIQELGTSTVKPLTDSRLDESPSFAPNGSMILYATVEGGRSVLAAVSADGRIRQELGVRAGKVREPAWSPFRTP